MTARFLALTGSLCVAALMGNVWLPPANGQCTAPCNTPIGSDVAVTDPASGITVVFSLVTQAGETVFLPLASAAQGFQVCRQANHFARCDVYSTGGYYIQTSAEFSGDVRVCMPYIDTGLSRLDELRLELYEVAACDDPRPGLCEESLGVKWVKISCDGDPGCGGTPLGDPACRDFIGNRLCGVTSGEAMRVPLHPSVELTSAVQGMLGDLLLPSSTSAGIGDVALEFEVTSGAGIGQVSIEVVDAEGAPISSEIIEPDPNPLTLLVNHVIPITRATANGTATIRVVVQNSSFTESAEAIGYFNVAGNEPPSCHANGPYAAECAGASTDLQLAGGESSDPEMDPLIYAWSTDCPGGAFDDSASPSPRLTVHAAAGCTVECSVTLLLSDGAKSGTCTSSVFIEDTAAPELACPGDAILEYPADTSAAATGAAAATDACASVTISHADSTSLTCGAAHTIHRTWQAADECENTATCIQTIAVQDTTPPSIDCPVDVTLEYPAATGPEATGAATAMDAGGEVMVAWTDSSAADCGAATTITRTWQAVDDCDNTATCVQVITIADTTPPVIHLDSTPIVVDNPDCSATDPVTLPPASTTDSCDAAPTLAHDAPSPFPTGTTLVTYTAMDACGNSSTTTLQVTVKYGATIQVDLAVDRIGTGARPQIIKQPLAGVDVCAYDISNDSCAFENCQGGPWQIQRQCVADQCGEVNFARTDANGMAWIDVPPGMYLLVAYPDAEHAEIMPNMIGGRMTAPVHCGQTKERHLRQMIKADNSKVPAKVTRRTGSELLVIEPEYVIWDQETQLYPFVFESLGDWGVVVSVVPPEGFVSDYQALDAEVSSEIEAVQFTVIEVGSDLVPTQTSFNVVHDGRRELIKSEVGIFLTEEYARRRGFDVATLRRQGLIREKDPRPPHDSHRRQAVDLAPTMTPATRQGGKAP